MFDNPIVLCKDCSYRSHGKKAQKPFDGTTECEWCEDTVEGTKYIVEDQEDPGPTPWQAARDELLEYLGSHTYTSDVRSRNRTIDFTIGKMDEWPTYTNNDHLNAIRSSSIRVGFIVDSDEVEFDEMKIHLPPGPEDLRGDIEEELDLPDNVGIHFGTGALGGMPAPDGVVTPHAIGKDIGVDKVRDTIEQVLDLYGDVYSEGEKILQKHP